MIVVIFVSRILRARQGPVPDADDDDAAAELLSKDG